MHTTHADITATTLAQTLREWRGAMTAREAAELLGLPKRTLDGIEQGRPFRYERMLRLAMAAQKQKPASG